MLQDDRVTVYPFLGICEEICQTSQRKHEDYFGCDRTQIQAMHINNERRFLIRLLLCVALHWPTEKILKISRYRCLRWVPNI